MFRIGGIHPYRHGQIHGICIVGEFIECGAFPAQTVVGVCQHRLEGGTAAAIEHPVFFQPDNHPFHSLRTAAGTDHMEDLPHKEEQRQTQYQNAQNNILHHKIFSMWDHSFPSLWAQT